MPFTAYDSFTDESFPQHKVFAVSYEPVWQNIRRGLPFVPYEDLRSTLAKLFSYLGLAQGEHDSQCRLFRVYNLLNAIPLGQGTPGGYKRIPRPEARLVTEARISVRERLEKVGKPEYWDWHEVRKTLFALWRDEDAVIFTYRELTWKRKSRPTKKPELTYFLQLIEETQPERQ